MFDPLAYTEELRQSWQDSAAKYAELSSRLFGPASEAFAEFSGAVPGDRVLDVACGPGTLTARLAARVGAQGGVVGCDLAPAMLELAKKAVPSAEFKEASAEALPFEDNSFDAVACQLGLMLFARPEKALFEMVRVARRGGDVACLVQGTANGMVFTSLPMRTFVRHAPELKVPGGPTLYAFGGHGALTDAMESAGLTAIVEKRLKGTYRFASAEDYWVGLKGGGRTARMLGSLPPEKQQAVQREVIEGARAYAQGGGVEIPYEFALARGLKL